MTTPLSWFEERKRGQSPSLLLLSDTGDDSYQHQGIFIKSISARKANENSRINQFNGKKKIKQDSKRAETQETWQTEPLSFTF